MKTSIALLSIGSLTLSAVAVASTATKTATETATPTKASPTVQHTTDTSGPPLNQYGAVNVKANVPIAAQVPPKPASLKLPMIQPLTTTFKGSVPPSPQLNVKSYLLMSADTGQVIASYNANQRHAPASLTKLMLLYLVDQALADGTLKLDQKISIPTVAWATGGSTMFLKPKQQVAVKDLISGIIVDSGNDAAVTLAVEIAGTQATFVDMMNQAAKKLGMTNTHFNDVMGLPAPNHFSSARDLGVLAHAIVEQYPQYLKWYGQKWFTYNGIRQPSFNKLLFLYPYADGMKTGSTSESGYSLIGTAKIPDRPMRLISVILGAPNANESAVDSKALLAYGFRFFKQTTLYTPAQTIQSIPVYMGNTKQVNIGVAQPIKLTVPSAQVKSLNANLKLPKTLVAPITKDQMVGTIEVKYHNQVIATAPAIALNQVDKGSVWQRMSGKVALWFKG